MKGWIFDLSCLIRVKFSIGWRFRGGFFFRFDFEFKDGSLDLLLIIRIEFGN